MNITKAESFRTTVEGIIILIEDELQSIDKNVVARDGFFEIYIPNSYAIHKKELDDALEIYKHEGGYPKITWSKYQNKIKIHFQVAEDLGISSEESEIN